MAISLIAAKLASLLRRFPAAKSKDRYLSAALCPFLLTPIPEAVFADIAKMLGFADNFATAPTAWYFPFLFVLTIATLAIFPAVLVLWTFVAPLWHCARRQPRKATSHLSVLILVFMIHQIDADWVRFKMKESAYAAQIADVTPSALGITATCMLDDWVEDRMYLGGMSFEPYSSYVVYWKGGMQMIDVPKIGIMNNCPYFTEVHAFRHLDKDFYLIKGQPRM